MPPRRLLVRAQIQRADRDGLAIHCLDHGSRDGRDGPVDQREAYATFNMGVGFAAYVAPRDVEATLAAAKATGYDAWLAGHVHQDGGKKAVVVPSLGLEFGGETLQVR